MGADKELAEVVRIHEEALKSARKVGVLAGIRLAADELRKWAARAIEEHGATSIAAVTLEDAADNLSTIADRLEEEG